jgi:hypothetical protein
MLCQWVTPEVAYLPHCACGTCELARLIFWTMDQYDMTAVWEKHFAWLIKRRHHYGQLLESEICAWQLRRVIEATHAEAERGLEATRGAPDVQGPTRLTSATRSESPPAGGSSS